MSLPQVSTPLRYSFKYPQAPLIPHTPTQQGLYSALCFPAFSNWQEEQTLPTDPLPGNYPRIKVEPLFFMISSVSSQYGQRMEWGEVLEWGGDAGQGGEMPFEDRPLVYWSLEADPRSVQWHKNRLVLFPLETPHQSHRSHCWDWGVKKHYHPLLKALLPSWTKLADAFHLSEPWLCSIKYR